MPSLIAVNRFMRFLGTSSGTPEAVLAARLMTRAEVPMQLCIVKLK